LARGISALPPFGTLVGVWWTRSHPGVRPRISSRCSIRPSCARIVGGRSKGGQEGQALGRSRGGFTAKIQTKSDASGDIIAFDLTGGEASDGRHFETLVDIGPDIRPRAVICDNGYASKANRGAARKRRIAPVIPHKANERDKPAFFARTLYKARARIEQGVERLKRFKRVALRCEKTARNFRSIVSFAAGLCLIKFAHLVCAVTRMTARQATVCPMTKTIGVSLFVLLIASLAKAESIGAVFYIPLENHNLDAANVGDVSASDLSQPCRAFHQQPGGPR
jgi:transposase